jgi:hypothetical protein
MLDAQGPGAPIGIERPGVPQGKGLLAAVDKRRTYCDALPFDVDMGKLKPWLIYAPPAPKHEDPTRPTNSNKKVRI